MRLLLYDPAWPLYEPLLRRYLEARWEIRCAANDPEWLRRELPCADALLCLKLPQEFRPEAKSLKAMLFPGAGVMHHDPSELPEGCVLANVYEHEIPMAEYILMTVLLHVTGALDSSAAFRAGRWEGNGRIGGSTHGEAFGRTLGLVGYGHIGQATAIRAKAFGMRVEAVRQRARALPESMVPPDFLGGPEDLDAMITRADILAIVCPLNPSTHNLIGRRQLAALRDGALLVNVARAEIVEEQALFDELKSGRIRAALDVWYQYPSGKGDVLHGSRLPFHELPGVFMTPHFSAWTAALVERRMRRIAENLDRLARGQELERVVLRGAWKAA